MNFHTPQNKISEEAMDSEGGSDSYVPVGKFFSGKAVLVTGGTGFLGKVLVEKLLRSCPGVKVIYLLIRPKRGRSIEERLGIATTCALFDRLKKENHSAISKIVPIPGDMSQPQMGLSPSDWSLLTQAVSVVFHCAATVNFDEPLNVAVDINLIGTKRMLELCREMTQLQALVHVSTAYSNCDLEQVDEVVYPRPHNPDDIIDCTRWMDKELLAHMQTKLVGKLPNTYVYTKSLAENVILKEGGDLPITIVRPSIVTSAWVEPVPGWVEGMNGPTALILAGTRGFLRTAMCDGHKVTDLIPVDVVVNVLICAAWRLGTTRPAGLTVYNCCTGNRNPITWNDFQNYTVDLLPVHPSSDILWYPVMSYKSNRLLHIVDWTLTQTLPQYTMDCLKKMSGQKPMFMKINTKLKKGCEKLEYFTTRQWRFCGDNVQQLSKCMQRDDCNTFRLDVEDINWRLYLRDYIFGTRTYVAKEDPKTVPQARARFTRIRIMYQGLQLAMILLFGYLVIMFLRMATMEETTRI